MKNLTDGLAANLVRTWQEKAVEKHGTTFLPRYDLLAVMQAEIDELRAAMQAMTAERDALNADAERYRWLRDQNADLAAGFYVGDETDALPEDITWVGSDLDAAVDLAMKGTS